MARTGKAAPAGSGRHRRSIWSDEAGAGGVEYSLLMVAFGLPLFFGMQYGLAMLQAHYSMWTYLNGWPFP
jgi:Flp pilus assembly protein TadG